MRQILQAELTWMGESFERGVRIEIDNGSIQSVTRGNSEENVTLKGKALMPGMINCHSHAFQRGLRGKGETYTGEGNFWTWRNEMYKLVENSTKESYYTEVKKCFEEMLRGGITSVGEFHYFHHENGPQLDFNFDDVTLQAANDAGIRIVLLNAFYKYSGFGPKELLPEQNRFNTPTLKHYFDNMNRLKTQLKSNQSLGVVAHSLRAVEAADVEELFAFSKEQKIPFHIHIEEQPAEVAGCQELLSRRPMEVLLSAFEKYEHKEELKYLNNVTAVHCNHTNSTDLQQFSDLGGMTCICPLTEGNLGDGIISDINNCNQQICLGSDCNARIDMFEECRLYEYSQRLLTLTRTASLNKNQSNLASLLMTYLTTVASRSLCLDAGSIEVGKLADFAEINLNHHLIDSVQDDHLAAALLFGTSAQQVVSRTCVGGNWIEFV